MEEYRKAQRISLRNKEFLASLFWMAMGFAIAVKSLEYKLGTPRRPGPGLFPFCVGISLLLLAIYLTADSVRSPSQTPAFFEQQGSLRRVLTTFISLLAYIYLVSVSGFIISTAIWTAFLLKSIYPQSWGRTIVFSAVVSILSYVVFQHLLEVQLPRGIIGF